MREDGKKGETRVKKYKEGSLESEKRAERKKTRGECKSRKKEEKKIDDRSERRG